MRRYDRLTTLMTRFSLTVRPCAAEAATLAVIADRDDAPGRVLFRARGRGVDPGAGRVLFAASVDWGGDANPLMAALPELSSFDMTEDAHGSALVGLLRAELEAGRCGAETAVNRLAEVLIIRLLRARIEAGSTTAGLLAGLADPRLSRAIVAMHDRPDRAWHNDDLAQIAGLSLSRFAETFRDRMGETPAGYLRRWRMLLARQDVARGDRIEAVARRYGYGSPEGFARAFKRHFGETPVALRPGGAGV
ncbi:MAG: AraC family transcriptional regulator [Paracoccaceae bacterium]